MAMRVLNASLLVAGVFSFILWLRQSIVVGPTSEEGKPSGANGPTSRLGWQAHSMNDLRLWPQLARKAPGPILSLKVDPHALDSRNESFLLTHDDPEDGVQYDTSDELLEAASSLLDSSSSLGLRIALCFKRIVEPCEGSAESEAWINAVDRLFAKATLVQDDYPNRLEFVLDGMAKPMDCLQDKWRPWVATWIPGDHSPEDALTSNNRTLGYDRYQVLNPSVGEAWQIAEKQNFGKFANGTYPVQLWEPDSQDEILQYADDFLGRFEESLHLDYAINIDPAMWTLFTSNAGIESSTRKDGTQVAANSQESGSHRRSWDLALPLAAADDRDGGPLTGPSNASSIFVPLPENRFLVLFNSNNSNSSTSIHFALFAYKTVFGNVSKVLEGNIAVADEVVAALSGEGPNDFLVLTRSRLEVFEIGSSSLSRVSAWDLPPSTLHPLAARKLGKFLGNSGPDLALLVQPRGQSHLELRHLRADSDEGLLWTSPTLPGLFEASSNFTDFVLVPTSSEDPSSDGRVIVVAGNGTHMFGASSSPGQTTWSLLGPGRSVSLAASLWPAAGGAVSQKNAAEGESEGAAAAAFYTVALLNDGGYCYNSHKHNTRASPKVCDATPQPCQSVLDYTIGSVEDWEETLVQQNVGSSSNNNNNTSNNNITTNNNNAAALLSPCSASLLHGSYGLGAAPSTALLEADGLALISLQQGYSEDQDTCGCGTPHPRPGATVLQGFALPSGIASSAKVNAKRHRKFDAATDDAATKDAKVIGNVNANKHGKFDAATKDIKIDGGRSPWQIEFV